MPGAAPGYAGKYSSAHSMSAILAVFRVAGNEPANASVVVGGTDVDNIAIKAGQHLFADSKAANTSETIATRCSTKYVVRLHVHPHFETCITTFYSRISIIVYNRMPPCCCYNWRLGKYRPPHIDVACIFLRS